MLNVLAVLLTVLFVGLKITGFITLSWWFVVVPISAVLLLTLFFIVCVVCSAIWGQR